MTHIHHRLSNKTSPFVVIAQINPYCPDLEAADTTKAATLLWKIFTSTLNDFGLDGTDFASCTKDSGSDVKSMCLNHTNRVGIEWDWCVSHMANKACEHGFGMAADPAKSKNPAARKLIQKVIRVVQRFN